MKPGEDGREQLAFESADALESWLEREHERSDGIWLKIAKKDTGVPTVTLSEAIDLGLCFGWIDGQSARVDETFYAIRYGPRRPRSVWSAVNVEKVAELTEAGRMRPAGQAQVDAAKADGRWERAYASPANAEPGPELERELARSRKARAAFDALSRSQRYAVIYRVGSGKKTETRERNAKKYAERLAKGEPLGL